MSTLSVKVISDVTAFSYVDTKISEVTGGNANGINASYATANAAFNAANNVNLGPVFTVANASFNTTNTSFNTANAAFNAANNVNLGPVFTVANAAYANANTKLANSSVTFSGDLTLTGNVLPVSSNTRDLGSSTARWRNIYTGDLHLSNEIGDWTIVEGEDELFLYNNLKDKVYKFNLTEVDPSSAPPKKGV